MTRSSRIIAILLATLLAWGPLNAGPPTGLQIHVTGIDDSQVLSVEVSDAAGAPVANASVIVRLEGQAAGSFGDGQTTGIFETDNAGKAHVTGIRWVPGKSANLRITATKGSAHAGLLIQKQVVPANAEIAKAPAAAVVVPAAPKVVIQSPSEPKHGSQVNSGAAAPPVAPKVSITSAPESKDHHGGKTKWVILAIVIAGAAGGAAAFAIPKSKNSSTTPAAGISFGTPTITVGAPAK